MRFPLPLLIGLFLTGVSPSLSSQTVGGQYDTIHRFDGSSSSDLLGNSVGGAGDVDGDGHPDLVVGVYAANWGGRWNSGAARVYSGFDGVLLHEWGGSRGEQYFGKSVSGVGDVNGDGFSDLLIGAPGAGSSWFPLIGSAFLFSGLDGSLIYQWDGPDPGDQMGWSVSGAGDVNGDGVPDVIVGEFENDPNGLDNAGSAHVFSGADGTLLHRFDGAAALDYFGYSVAGAGDANGDGFADLLVGAYEADPGGLTGAGSAFLYSGLDGSLLRRFDGMAVGDHLGKAVSGAADVDGDGLDDQILGSLDSDPGGMSSAGSAFVHSGADGAILHRFDGESPADWFGQSVGAAGDLDGDGIHDLVVGAHSANPGGITRAGSAYLFSGATGTLVARLDGFSPEERMGVSVSGAGDVDLDGFADTILGVYRSSPGGITYAGSALVVGFNPILHSHPDSIAAAAGGTVQVTMDFPDSEAGLPYVVLLSSTGTGPTSLGGFLIPLTPDPLFWRSFWGNHPLDFSGGLGVLGPFGKADASYSAPPGRLFHALGQTFWGAAVSYGPGLHGRISSVAVSFTVVP